MNAEDTILQFIREELLEDDVEIDADTLLFSDQLLDSMSLTRLVVFLESTFPINVSATDIALENLGTVNHMKAFIERKQD